MQSRRHATCGMAAPVALASVCISMLAQAPITTTTKEVLVDVVVRDRHGRLVRDLEAGDFEIYEDGVQQKITSFHNIEGQEQLASGNPSTTAESGAPARSTSAAAPPDQLREAHFVTIVVGEIAPAHLSFARGTLEEFIKTELPPDTYVTVLRTDHTVSIVQPFTTDKNALLRAAQRATTLHATNLASAEAAANSESALTSAMDVATGPGANPAAQPIYDPSDPVSQRVGPLNAAQQTEAALADSLRFVGDYVSGMNTLDMLHEIIRSQARLHARKVALYLADGLALPAQRPDAFAAVISDANRAGVTFYTFDTKGLFVADNPLVTPATQGVAQLNRATAESRMTGALNQGSLHGSAALDAMSAAEDVTLLASANPDLSMQELAVRTGGFATMSTNNILDPMRRVVEDIGTHYELTYTPISRFYDGRFRKIDVKVSRPKVTIEARRGYFALPEINGEPIQPFEFAALTAIEARPQPRAIPYRAELLTFRPQQSGLQCAVAWEVPIGSLTPARDGKTGSFHLRIALMGLIQDASGQIVHRISRQMVRDIPSAQWPEAQRESIHYSEPVTLAPGRYTLSTALVDDSSSAQGEKSAAKRVAEFISLSGQLALSSIELVERVEPLNRPANPLNPFEMPGKRLRITLSDTVAKGKPASLYFVIYPNQKTGAAPELFVQLFQNGKEVARTSPALPKPDATGAISVYAELSPPAGSYDVYVTVKQSGYTAQQTRSLIIE